MTPEQIEIGDLYRRARLAMCYREAFGKLPNIDHLPEWVRNNLDELTLTTLRVQLIEAFREGTAPQQWEPHDEEGPPRGDWINISENPEALVEWIDTTTREEINKMAADILRDLLSGPDTNTPRI